MGALAWGGADWGEAAHTDLRGHLDFKESGRRVLNNKPCDRT